MSQINATQGLSFNAGESISIVNAALKAGLFFPHSCTVGRCKTCKCKVVSGCTTLLLDELGLSDTEKSQGWILACVRVAVGNLTISDVTLSETPMPEIKMVPCRINSLEYLTHDILKVVLRMPPSQKLSYYPGQYINVIRDEVRRSYSIANFCTGEGLLELHIKKYDGGLMSKYWFLEAKVNDLLRMNGPIGTFFLRNIANKDLIFLATGTGFAPVKALLESILHSKKCDWPRSVRVYWGGRIASDMYSEAPEIGFPYVFKRVLSRSSDGDAKGYVQNACLDDVADFQNTQVYACGSNAMIEDARSLLVKAGLEETDFYSDAFVCSAS